MGGPSNCYRSIAWTNMNATFAQAQLGLIDYGVLGATQIDLHGNINSTMLGDDWYHPKKRFPGAGGANEVASYCWRTIVIMMHEPRRFVPRVDFISSPGYLDGSPGARERAGLPAGTGPWRVVTSKALFGFDADSRTLTLLGVLAGLSVEEVLGELGARPLVAAPVETLASPTERELAFLRGEIDPAWSIIGRAATA
jgi:glutaconate CoA-transferase subunit B